MHSMVFLQVSFLSFAIKIYWARVDEGDLCIVFKFQGGKKLANFPTLKTLLRAWGLRSLKVTKIPGKNLLWKKRPCWASKQGVLCVHRKHSSAGNPPHERKILIWDICHHTGDVQKMLVNLLIFSKIFTLNRKMVLKVFKCGLTMEFLNIYTKIAWLT